MKPNLIVLDGYALNPGDLDWNLFHSIAQITVYPRTPAEEVIHGLVQQMRY